MTFNVWTFLFQIINFSVVAFVLHRLLYEPLHKAIDNRRMAHEQAQAEAEKARQAAVQLQNELQSKLVDLDRQREGVLRQAAERSESERQKLLAETEQTAKRRREEMQNALDRERTEAMQAIHRDIVEQAIDLTQRLLGRAADRTLDEQLAKRLVETLAAAAPHELEQLRRGRAQDDAAVLEAAHELSGDAVNAIHAALNTLLGQTVTLNTRAVPELLGGVRLKIGGQVWDASLAGQLADAA